VDDADLGGRGFLLIEQFCASTGLAAPTVRSLIEQGRLQGLLDRPGGRAVGIFDDTLPAADELRAMGLKVHAAYHPEKLRSFVDVEREAHVEVDPGDDEGPSWTMSW
jgi:hypothetical protein